jgi:hypothetical protein
MRRSSKRLGHVLETYDQATAQRVPRAGVPGSGPRLLSVSPPASAEPEHVTHEAYRRGVAEQAAGYLADLQAGQRVMMHFEYHTLSPIDGGPRDIDVLDALRVLCREAGIDFTAEQVHDIGVHLTVAERLPDPVRLRPTPAGEARR